MTFTIDREPETRERLRAVAAARGEDPNRYAADVFAHLEARYGLPAS